MVLDHELVSVDSYMYSDFVHKSHVSPSASSALISPVWLYNYKCT